MKIQIVAIIILVSIILKIYKIVNIDTFTLFLISLISLIIFYDNSIENFEVSNEAVQNVGGIYNASKMKVTDLEVTGTLTAGNWKIRKDRIGIPDRGDMHLASDQWIRLKVYDGEGYNEQGFAGRNSYSDNDNYIGGFCRAKNIFALGKLTIPAAKIGEWEIRDHKIGIPEIGGDINFGGATKDHWVRLVNYNDDTNTSYLGPVGAAGWAGASIWHL